MTTAVMAREAGFGKMLAACHGFEAVACDDVVGEVETPLFPPGSRAPDYLVLRLYRPGRILPSFVVVSAVLVEEVDSEQRCVRLGLSGEKVLQLPEHLPAVDAALAGPAT